MALESESLNVLKRLRKTTIYLKDAWSLIRFGDAIKPQVTVYKHLGPDTFLAFSHFLC
jgi:hypothetical protein